MKPEKRFEKKIVEGLKAGGALVKKVHGSFISSGWPDLYVMHPDFHGHIELKVNHLLKPNQEKKLKAIAKQRIPAIIARLNGGTVTFERIIYYPDINYFKSEISTRSLHICTGENFIKFLSKL